MNIIWEKLVLCKLFYYKERFENGYERIRKENVVYELDKTKTILTREQQHVYENRSNSTTKLQTYCAAPGPVELMLHL